MDFFEQQAKAHRKTKWLVIYFAVAVVLIIAAVYVVSLLAFNVTQSNHRNYGSGQFIPSWWNTQVFLGAAFGTLAVIFFGSLYKMNELAGGGAVVAANLGGRLVNPNTTDPDERKLLNVVEEMAIASGVPVPQVFVLDEEQGINAFAAGHTTGDAVVAVTRGCMKMLNRDQLQGVIGHEFSHILNGDMRLNLRLIGVIFGILCLATIGRILLRTRGRKNPLPILGLALLIIGSIGVLFGRLIQAAVSRQREFLADASSVQFTRNPGGLSGALQKIGRFDFGSRLESEHAPDLCHMFFGNAMGEPFFNFFATHPPIPDRIRAIDPTWDGKYPPIEKQEAETVQRAAIAGLKHPPRPMQNIFGSVLGGVVIAGGSEESPPQAPTVIKPHTVLPNLGNPTPLHLQYAQQLRESLPDSVKAAAHDPLGAAALVYALLLSGDEGQRATQIAEIGKRFSPAVSEKTAALFPDVSAAAKHARLPMVNLALGTLRHLTTDQYNQFSQALQWLIESDGKVELFEFVLQKIIRHHLAPQFGQAPRTVVQFYSVKPLVPDCAVLLSALANVSSADTAEIQKAFDSGAPYLRSPDDSGLQLLPREQCGVNPIDAALNRLAQASPLIKKNLLEACVHVVGADGVIQETEAELLRAVADTLDCPMPPMVTA